MFNGTDGCVWSHHSRFYYQSNIGVLLETDIVLEPTHVDFPATGLQNPSILKLNRLMMVRKTLIRRELGNISPALQLEIDQKLHQLFELD